MITITKTPFLRNQRGVTWKENVVKSPSFLTHDHPQDFDYRRL